MASPADTSRRLVYADWLEERGDPRSEYVRLRVEIDKFAPHTSRYGELRNRLKELRGQMDSVWLNAMGYQLRHRPLFTVMPERRKDRWRLIDEFIEIWHGPLGSEDGYSEEELESAERRLGLKLPLALREWYTLAGRRADVWSVQDRVLSPAQLEIDDRTATLIIRSENQWCERWGIRLADLNQDDPPIVEVDANLQGSPTTSAFACLVLLYEVMFAAGVFSGAGATPRLQAAASRGLFRCDCPDRYWVGSPIQIFEGDDLIVSLHGDEWVYVAARNAQAMQQLDSEVLAELEVYKS